jgi:alpha-amylase/alpha-mannosidase (GH57 family)
MNRVHLMLLWHMHQPQYRDPSTGSYRMPWTRLHALKDYWGMVKLLEEVPGMRATFNLVPSLGAQLEEYAGGEFDEPAFRMAFAPAASLGPAERMALLEQAFQANRENQIRRWPRFWELYRRVEDFGAAAAAAEFVQRDWRDLQVLSQLAWMDEEYLARDPVVSQLSRKGSHYTEEERQQLRAKQLELLARVLPEYKRAAERGQIELSTTPYYHPILPLLCDSSVARVANPHTPPLEPPFRHPEDAREQLRRARDYHQRVFGAAPAGLWPSEGSVSDATLELAAGMGFRWFATDEGVLGRTLGSSFQRDAHGIPANADQLYAPHAFRTGQGTLTGFFRDHLISDLVGFVYSRMDQRAAAEDLHRRIRNIGEHVKTGRPVTVSIILDGENAWEYYAGSGREFLREFYRRVAEDPDIRPLTASEAAAEAGEIETHEHIHPGSWINANFDIWIGHAEDVRAWELLREAREFYAQAEKAQAVAHAGAEGAHLAAPLQRAYEALLAAEGSDWCWWFGPEHASSQDDQFDALYRKHLSEVYSALDAPTPDALAEPIKGKPERALFVPPQSRITARIDGRESSYFEWLGAGIYAADRQAGSMHGRNYLLREIQYGFDADNLYVRVDPFAGALEDFEECEFRLRVAAPDGEELHVTASIEGGRVSGVVVEQGGVCLLHPEKSVEAAFRKILEVRIARQLLMAQPGAQPDGSAHALGSEVAGHKRGTLSLGVTLWQGWLPVDILPAEGRLEIELGEEAFAWAV